MTISLSMGTLIQRYPEQAAKTEAHIKGKSPGREDCLKSKRAQDQYAKYQEVS